MVVSTCFVCVSLCVTLTRIAFVPPLSIIHRCFRYCHWCLFSSAQWQLEEMPIAFFSKKMTLSQMKWSTIEREAFSMLEALRKFDTWIFGSQIQVISDHDNLTSYQQCQIDQMGMALQRYNVKVSYRRGSAHRNADALSRLRISK
ncbi:retrovirus-related Pol polyprotein from transposon 297 [Trichonephila clavipes]|nr:retrovirus-related Pol polyprotein from transposon 297 [Trichonephila clavipes]